MVGAKDLDNLLLLFEQTGGEISRLGARIRRALMERNFLEIRDLLTRLEEVAFSDEMGAAVRDLKAKIVIAQKEGIAGRLPEVVPLI